MKNILIFGSSRMGKTTLAKRLKDEFGLNVVNWDVLIHAFALGFPQLGVSFQGDFEQTRKNVTPFSAYYLCEMARHARYKTGSKFIADMSLFNFDVGFPLMEEHLLSMGGTKLHEEFTIIHLINTKPSEEMFRDIRQYDTDNDWTFYLDDTALRNWCNQQTGANPLIVAKLDEFNPLRYDVAQGREQVFDEIVKDLKAIRI